MQGGLLQSMGAEEAQAQSDHLAEEKRQNADLNNNQEQVVSSLAHYVKSCWETAKHHKITVTERLTSCLRRRNGVYDAETKAKIAKAGGSSIYMGITGTKIKHAKAWLSDLFSPSGDKPFTISPTPIAELPPELKQNLIMQAMHGAMQLGVPEEIAFQLMQKHQERLKDELRQEAETRMEGMSQYIQDLLVEGNWRTEFDEFLEDLTTYPSAIMKGVVFRSKKQVKWVQMDTGKHMPQISNEISKEFRRVSPFDAYPAPNTVNIGDSWFCEHLRYTPQALADMRDMQGYNKEAIEQVLGQYRVSGFREWLFNDSEREQLEGRENSQAYNYDMLDAVEFNGHIQGKQLLEWGMNPNQVEDHFKEYPVSVTLIGTHIIRAVMSHDPTGRPPYFKASWHNIPNSFWGEALAESIADIQDAGNSTARALMNNMAMGSAPQTSVDVSMLPTGADPTAIYPRKVWLYDSTKANHRGGSAGVNFFSPEIKANELLAVYERFERYADEKSGIPAYMQGSSVGSGAGRTASGLSMLMNASSKTIKDVVRNIDLGVIEPAINSIYITAMLDPDVPEEFKGDAKVQSRGSDGLLHKEAAQIRQQELLQLTNNPVDLSIIGLEGRSEQLREVFKNGSIPVDRIIPTKDKLQAQQQALQQQNQPTAEKNQAKQA